MTTTPNKTSEPPTQFQQLAWHAMNALPGLAIFFVWKAETVAGAVISVAAGVGAAVIGHQWKKRGQQQAGEERLRVGSVTPVAPEGGSVSYVFGLLIFVLLTVGVFFIPDFRQLVRVAMSVMMVGVSLCFVALINPKFRKLALAVFALAMLAGGGLIVADGVLIYQEGGEGAVLSAVKTGLFAALLLFGGAATTWGVMRSRKSNLVATPLFENGMNTQWGFMPWSMLTVALNETNGDHILEATAFNGWRYQMLVGDDQLDAARQLLAEIGS